MGAPCAVCRVPCAVCRVPCAVCLALALALAGLGTHLPFCNTTLTHVERVHDLISRLNMTEKAGLMGAGSTSCSFQDAGVGRLGIPVYTWCTKRHRCTLCLAPSTLRLAIPSIQPPIFCFMGVVSQFSGVLCLQYRQTLRMVFNRMKVCQTW